MKTKSQIYRDALAAWSRGDIQAMLDNYHQDVVWYPNRALRAVQGKTAIVAFMAKFGQGMSELNYEQSLLIEQGNMLFVEGTERYVKNGRAVSVPYAGVVEFQGNKIIAMRDYFDLQSLEKQLIA